MIPKILMLPGYIYVSYKLNGFRKGTKSVYYYLKMELIGYLYKNWKWFNLWLRKRAKTEAELILLDLMYDVESWSLQNMVSKYPEFRAYFINNFETIKEDSCNKIIKELNITDENEILKIKDSFKLENYI